MDGEWKRSKTYWPEEAKVCQVFDAIFNDVVPAKKIRFEFSADWATIALDGALFRPDGVCKNTRLPEDVTASYENIGAILEIKTGKNAEKENITIGEAWRNRSRKHA